jgi:solute:Na+ symporter, SSS family
VAGWRPIAQLSPDISPTRDLGRNLVSWILGCAMVYLALFGLGHVLIGPMSEGLLLLGGSGLCAVTLYANLVRRGWESTSD